MNDEYVDDTGTINAAASALIDPYYGDASEPEPSQTTNPNEGAMCWIDRGVTVDLKHPQSVDELLEVEIRFSIPELNVTSTHPNGETVFGAVRTEPMSRVSNHMYFMLCDGDIPVWWQHFSNQPADVEREGHSPYPPIGEEVVLRMQVRSRDGVDWDRNSLRLKWVIDDAVVVREDFGNVERVQAATQALMKLHSIKVTS